MSLRRGTFGLFSSIGFTMTAALATRPELAAHLPPGPPSVLIGAGAVGSVLWIKSVWDRRIDQDLKQSEVKEVEQRLNAIEKDLLASRAASRHSAPEHERVDKRSADRNVRGRPSVDHRRANERNRERDRNLGRGHTRD
jgi:hypothetical protein